MGLSSIGGLLPTIIAAPRIRRSGLFGASPVSELSPTVTAAPQVRGLGLFRDLSLLDIGGREGAQWSGGLEGDQVVGWTCRPLTGPFCIRTR
jgi:hypothetical protein